jgi:cytosol alanyl aminopeptidase
VGPLQSIAQAGTEPPVRVLAPVGRTGGTAAAQASAKLTDILATYTGTPYPYGKLDLVAVPQFSAGAMENAGLITFREERLLLPGQVPPRSLRGLELIVAHELAHQWTGNLVTPEFWDELWLSEGFASFLEAKAVDVLHGDHAAQRLAAVATLGVMESESLASTRVVRQPATTTADAFDAFDDVTYTKGAALLRMAESYVGEVAFRAALANYLRARAHQNATTEDFLRELDLAAQNAGVDKQASDETARWRRLAPSELLAPYLQQRGVPVMKVGVSCLNHGVWVSIRHTSSHGADDGDSATPLPVPFCLALDGERYCSISAERWGVGTERIKPIKGGIFMHFQPAKHQACPQKATISDAIEPYAWVLLDTPTDLPNLVSMEGSLADSVMGPRLVMSAAALFRSRDADGNYLRKMLLATLTSHDPAVGLATVQALRSLAPSIRRDPGFQQFTRRVLEPKLRRLTLQQLPRDTAIDLELRRGLALALADLAPSAALTQQARAIVAKWMKDRTCVAPDDAYLALEVVARADSNADFDDFWRAYLAGGTTQDRAALLKALGGFAAPVLIEKLYAHVLDHAISLQDVRYLTRAALMRGTGRAAVLQWATKHSDALRAAMPNSSIAHLAPLLEAGCDGPSAAQAAAMLKPTIAAVEGGARAAAQATERAARCTADETRAPELQQLLAH